MPEKIAENDHRKRRCPKLGHDLQFAYCRQPGSDLPCAKIFDCWFETFDVKSFIDNAYPPAVIAEITTPPKPKVASLIELIQRAQRNNPPQ